MPVTIQEIKTQAGITLRVGQWVEIPNTRYQEHAYIEAFTMRTRKADNMPAIKVQVQRIGPYICSHPCLTPVGTPGVHDPEELTIPEFPPELGWCDARNNYAHFDVRTREQT